MDLEILRQHVHVLFMMPFTYQVFITAAAIVYSPSSGNGCHCLLFTSRTSITLGTHPARMEVGGATIKEGLV